MTKKRRAKQRETFDRKRRHEILSNLTDEELQQKLVAKYPTLDPFQKLTPYLSFKHKIRLCIGVILASPILLVFTFGARNVSSGSFQPVFIVMGIGQLWGLLFMIGHRSIDQKGYAVLTSKEQQYQLLYDAFWDGLIRSGFGVYAAVVLVWGIVELCIVHAQQMISIMLVVLDVILVVALLTEQRWLTKVLVEGLKKHKIVGRVWGGLLGFLLTVLAIGGGMGSIARVTTEIAPESRYFVFNLMIVILNFLAIFCFVLGVSGLVITRAYYQQWRQTR